MYAQTWPPVLRLISNKSVYIVIQSKETQTSFYRNAPRDPTAS